MNKNDLLRLIKEELNCQFPLKLTQELIDEVNKFNTSEELLRAGGISIETLDRAAFGFSADDIKTLMPNQLNIMWKDDYENVVWQQERSGLSKIEYAKRINLSEPIDVIYEKDKFYVDDGYHRWFAAKTLNKPLNVSLTIKQNPIIKLTGNKMGYDDYHRCLFNQVKNIK